MSRRNAIEARLNSSDPLTWLQGWYYAMCNGDWEHGFGPSITTYDNPGWGLKISLVGTYSDERPFDGVQLERHEHDWVICHVEHQSFHGAGGPLNLSELISIFRAWATPGLEINAFPEADEPKDAE